MLLLSSYLSSHSRRNKGTRNNNNNNNDKSSSVSFSSSFFPSAELCRGDSFTCVGLLRCSSGSLSGCYLCAVIQTRVRCVARVRHCAVLLRHNHHRRCCRCLSVTKERLGSARCCLCCQPAPPAPCHLLLREEGGATNHGAEEE